MKENICEKVTKILFPNRDVISLFGKDLNITYLTKCLNSNNSGICDILKALYIFPISSNTLVMV